ncbi:hypothetical protein ACR8AL_11760 [Clavibacter sepedonicus]|uniref:Integral membrane protein n=3 Tax=Clavibacter sepedonicus TaxID=31964 RepID=B0RBW6_CLASE|nr:MULTISPECIES: hypothetical protein [Clavibacter]MBD5383016.1 hypothetical protein [Clavibacter sp.]OQJ48931.1 hypothetical protein B5P19_12280 [Clavibacter sepedonicus]OQJ53758.1 hypothetical protein B5P20_06170 [Clavibacter sepedonicus]UUK65257.1 hypothetical protein LRE50_13395 [Clavibacter sepedonicus]CAQ00518.1 putative integral membrane protein [Clavibacter sepedonicus]
MSARMAGPLLRRRLRATHAAAVTGLVVVLVVVVVVLLPVLGFIGAADAATVGQLDVPVTLIALGVGVSLVVAVVMLVVSARTRDGRVAWVAAVSAVVATLVGSAWPLVATVIASVDQVQDAIPFVQDLVGRVLGG